MLGKLPSYHLKNPFRTVSKAPPRTHSSSRSPSERQKGAGPAAGPAPIVPLSRCSLLLLPHEPTGYQPTSHQQRTSTQREQRRSTATTGRRQLLRSRSRRRSRGTRRRRRRRGGLRRRRRRRRLTRGLGYNASGLRLYNAVLTLGLGLRSSGLGLLGLGIGHNGRLVLGESGRSGHHSHRQHRR